ncbi:hypothetical protein FQZ97_1063990 [compost metagenome]
MLSPPDIHTPAIAAMMPIGTIKMIAIGSVRLSYCAASTRNTSRIASGNTRKAELPARISW